MNERPKYATLEDVGRAIASLEAKVPSRWEVRSLILAGIVVANFDVPNEITASAVGLAIAIPVVKALIAGHSS